MAVYTVISKNYPEELEVRSDFPKCVCGGDFRVYDNFNKAGSFYGTTADCKECKEHFVGDSYRDLHNRIPSCQELRAKAKLK